MADKAYEIKLNRSIDRMGTAELRYAVMEYEEKHQNNLEYISSLREEINELKAELEEAQDTSSPAKRLDIAGLKFD